MGWRRRSPSSAGQSRGARASATTRSRGPVAESGATGNGRIEAVVCDFGGVLTTPLMGSFIALQDEHGVSVEAFGEAMKAAADAGDGEIPLFKLERGDITEPEFLDVLRDGLEPLIGHRPHLHRFREIFFDALDPNEPMIELMREVK